MAVWLSLCVLSTGFHSHFWSFEIFAYLMKCDFLLPTGLREVMKHMFSVKIATFQKTVCRCWPHNVRSLWTRLPTDDKLNLVYARLKFSQAKWEYEHKDNDTRNCPRLWLLQLSRLFTEHKHDICFSQIYGDTALVLLSSLFYSVHANQMDIVKKSFGTWMICAAWSWVPIDMSWQFISSMRSSLWRRPSWEAMPPSICNKPVENVHLLLCWFLSHESTMWFTVGQK